VLSLFFNNKYYRRNKSKLLRRSLCTCLIAVTGLDVLEDVREVMDDDHRASGIDVEVTCEDCNETF
jgi:hypothetical protein